MLPNSDKQSQVEHVYSQLDRKFEEQETKRLSGQKNLPYMNLYGFPLDSQALEILSRHEAESFGAAVFFKEGHSIKLGTIHDRAGVLPLLKKLEAEHYQVEPFYISQSSFNRILEEYGRVLQTERKSDKIAIRPDDHSEGLKELSTKLSSATATEMIESVLAGALMINASDIHLEPEAKDLKIRYRIDGVLQDVATSTKEVHQQLVSRIKILSKLKLNVTNVPQDGSFSLTYNHMPVDVRVSALPSAYGESLVLRLLRQDKGSLKFEELGITGLARERILEQMHKPNGMIITTGPTGSGKTTTLYAMLNKLNESGVKIITLEDPVEYRIEGITQTPIDARAGMGFAEGLRAVLRQDPDVVMVGEMRDLETAETAAQAALTGHIVLSTLHTNDAPSAIPRLLDLGVRAFVLAPAINAVIGQRLVRRSCSECKQEYILAPELRKRVEMILRSVPQAAQAQIPTQLKFTHSIGCDKCHGLGYKGRIGIYEVFAISEEIEKLINSGATTSEIKKQAIAEGMLTMAQDGLLKALAGLTDVEEIFRVVE